MKKRGLLLMLALPLLFGCGPGTDEPDSVPKLTAEPLELTVGPDKTSAVITIKSNVQWRVSCFDVSPTLDKDRWLSGFTKSGENDGSVEITFTPNLSTEITRTATFRLIYGERNVDVHFSQNPAEFVAVLEIAHPEVSVSWDETSASFAVTANSPWTVSTTSDWIHNYTQGGPGDGEIVVGFDRNSDTTSPRTATLTVTSAAGSRELTITQGQAPEREEAQEVSIAGFMAAAESDQVLYRLTGMVERLISATYGSMRIKDNSGTAMVYCLLTGKDGEDGAFERLGVQVGDCITVVGKRGPTLGGPETLPEMVGGYYEGHKAVRTVSIADYLQRPDGNATWFRLTGEVSDVTDAQNGSFVLSDNGASVHVSGMVAGLGGAAGSYAGLGIVAGARLTLIATQKAGSTTTDAIYVSHSNPGLAPGVAARWAFDTTTNAQVHFDRTWSAADIDADGQVSTYDFSTAAGDGGRYIDAVEGSGRLTYVQSDKAASDPQGNIAARLVFYTAQPAVKGSAVGDYFLFTFDPGVQIPSGTKFKFSFCLRPEGAAPGYYMVEYLDGTQWTTVTGLATQNKEGYSYNVARATSEQTLTNCQFMTANNMESLQIRISIAAPYTAGGNAFSGALASGAVRFRGVVSGKDLSPVISILE